MHKHIHFSARVNSFSGLLCFLIFFIFLLFWFFLKTKEYYERVFGFDLTPKLYTTALKKKLEKKKGQKIKKAKGEHKSRCAHTPNFYSADLTNKRQSNQPLESNPINQKGLVLNQAKLYKNSLLSKCLTQLTKLKNLTEPVKLQLPNVFNL